MWLGCDNLESIVMTKAFCDEKYLSFHNQSLSGSLRATLLKASDRKTSDVCETDTNISSTLSSVPTLSHEHAESECSV